MRKGKGTVDVLKKYCPQCSNFSYSSNENRDWICPTCGENLTECPAMMLDQQETGEIKHHESRITPNGCLKVSE